MPRISRKPQRLFPGPGAEENSSAGDPFFSIRRVRNFFFIKHKRYQSFPGSYRFYEIAERTDTSVRPDHAVEAIFFLFYRYLWYCVNAE